MRPIVIDQVAWSVSLSHLSALQEWLHRSRCRLGCGLGWAQGIVLDGVPGPNAKGQFWDKEVPTVKCRDLLQWGVQKRLNWSICCLGCGLRSAEGNTILIAFTRWCQCPSWEFSLAPPVEYDWTVRLRRWCGLMSNYFDHLFGIAVETLTCLCKCVVIGLSQCWSCVLKNNLSDGWRLMSFSTLIVIGEWHEWRPGQRVVKLW